MKQALLILGVAATMGGCSTDLDINAPYQDITVVYGLLNMRDSIQYIKINKAFLGEGDAFDFAQIPDSNEWGDAITSAKVKRILNGQTVSVFELRDTLVTNREPGIFYSPDQHVYYFSDNFRGNQPQGGVPTTMYLDWSSQYVVEIEVKGQVVSGRTTIVDDFSFNGADQTLTSRVNLMTFNGYGGFELNWNSDYDGKRYVAEYRFNYKEVYSNGDTSELKSITQEMDRIVASNSQISQTMSGYMEGELFFNTLANTIPVNAAVTSRIFLGLDFIVSVANDDFHTYLTLTEPVTGIIEDRPAYSNISNGYGLFGSRYQKFIIGKTFDSNTMAELADGPITSGLRFCTAMPQDVNSAYACP